MVFGPLTATILPIHRCAASSLSFSIFSNALTSGFVLHIGGWSGGKSRAPAKADTEAAMKPKTQWLTIRIPHPYRFSTRQYKRLALGVADYSRRCRTLPGPVR